MSSPGSVTTWIGELQAGQHDAAQHLFDRYFRRLVGLARLKLRNMSTRGADEEDVALSAFASFCRGAEKGRFPQLCDHTNLWPRLVLITARKACDLIQRNQSKKRGGGKVRGESGFHQLQKPGSVEPGIQEVLSREPTPADAAIFREEYQQALNQLGDDTLREIAILKMDRYTNKEIAVYLDCSLTAVERKLKLIRTILAKRLTL